MIEAEKPIWMSWSAKYVVTLCLITVGTAISACTADRTREADHAAKQETVIVFHGLGRTETAVWLLARRIEAAGFQVVRIGYNSLDDPPDRILAEVRREVDAFCKASRNPVNFVGHSLGGLIIRGYLAESRVCTLGRVVLIATPNSGTPLVDTYRDSWWINLAGPAAKSLGTDPKSFPNSLPAPDYPVGIIAGVGESPLVDMIPGKDDGLVPLESTKTANMTDFIAVDSNHLSMRYSQEVAQQTIAFLKTGHFRHSREHVPADEHIRGP